MQPRYGKDWYFNPRSREGSDALFSCFYTFLFISIHAPAKGATTGRWTADLQFDISIHAPAKGATPNGYGSVHKLSGFQSTLPRRERPVGLHHEGRGTYFNPRSREGSDGILICRCLGIIYFNPRSREGSDIACKYFDAGVGISIHAPAKGATPATFIIAFTSSISIHAPAKGATWRISQQLPIIQFQSTLPRRERRDPDMPVLGDHIFQSTLPRRERHCL